MSADFMTVRLHLPGVCVTGVVVTCSEPGFVC